MYGPSNTGLESAETVNENKDQIQQLTADLK